MKILKNSILALFTLVMLTSNAQIQQPVKWNIDSRKTSDTEYELLFKATIDNGWHLFSQYLPEGNYSLPTEFSFKITDAERIDTVRELSTIEIVKDETAGVMTHYFSNSAIFAQTIKIVGNQPVVNGTIDFQTCNDEQCIKDDYEFHLTLSNGKFVSTTSDVSNQQIIEEQKDTTKVLKSNSLWRIILEAILWGFAALLTPCVFPMVPMTVSFFLKNENNKGRSRSMATTFGLSIVAIYTIPIAIIIMATYLIGGQAITADIFNWLSTHWLPNLLFFFIFMFFAASFFGAFDIVLPSSIVNGADKKANKGGLAGTMFMALTLVLVSFSCTGPIVGTIIVKSTQGDIWEPIITMLAFSVAFALPFTLLAFFPSAIKKLPKSGSWLNVVKIALGFIELALGLKFLSVADQTYHWGILDREVYLAIWISIFTLLGLFLLGKIHLRGAKYKAIGSLRLILGMITFAFVIYLIPGMWGAPLKALSGYLPPQTSIDFDLSQKTLVANVNTDESSLCETPKYADILHLPHGLQGYFDYNQALECAKKQNKPIFVDFTGHGCVNCREMEARVWADEQVLQRLRNNYIVVALYVDDKTELPEQEWITSAFDGKLKKSIGKKNADLQVSQFKINAQPYYCLLDTAGNLLVEPRGYNLNINEFIHFLDEGIEKFKNISE